LAGELKASECEQSGSVSTGEIAEVADTDKPRGRTCWQKRRRNSVAVRVMMRCLLP
jgi:hypothetical protein